MSDEVGELLKYGSVTLSLDLFPTMDYEKLDRRLQDVFAEGSNKKVKNALGGLVPTAFSPIITALLKIDPDTFCHSVRREKRIKLVKLLKDIPLNVKGLLGLEKAIVTSGGVALTEVDFKTMRSRLFPNLYLIGDVLNINRPSGGYSLQLCWTTGFVAGNASVQR